MIMFIVQNARTSSGANPGFLLITGWMDAMNAMDCDGLYGMGMSGF